MIYKIGIHRPMTMGIQTALGFEPADVDGYFGPMTVGAVKAWQTEHGLEPTGEVDSETFRVMSPEIPPAFKIGEVICSFEVGWVRNAWARATIVKAEGWTNYGPWQINRAKGSVQNFCAMYLPVGQTFEVYIGTPHGAKAMWKYFMEVLLGRVLECADEIFENVTMDTQPHLLGLMLDAMTQGGDPFPTHPVAPENMSRCWPDGSTWSTWREKVLERYDGIGYNERRQAKDAFIESLQTAQELGIPEAEAYAELHPRSGLTQWLEDQLSRRRFWICEESKVHGEWFRKSDFGL